MMLHLTFNGHNYKVNPLHPLDISIPLRAGEKNPNCYNAPPVAFKTIRSGDFIGSIREGGSVNYQTIEITPHGNGTHTECYGHITASGATINSSLKKFLFPAELLTVSPIKLANGDEIITEESVRKARHYAGTEAVIVRTLPNDEEKITKNYSGKNPPYFEPGALRWLAQQEVNHFLTDLPSVDREEDEGRLSAHKAFWSTNTGKPRINSTITELIYINNKINDGLYLLNLQIAPIEGDASPSKPIIYKMLQQL